MPKYIVTQTCTYSIAIEADNHEEAEQKAEEHSLDHWQQDWSSLVLEVEESDW